MINWIKFSICKPRNGLSVWMYMNGQKPTLVHSFDVTHGGDRWTHWMPAEVPNPPEPEKSPEEVAFEK